MVGHGSLEVAKTVLEVADVAWTAVETCEHFHHHNSKEQQGDDHDNSDNHQPINNDEEFECLRSENQRLMNLLEQNLELLKNLSESPTFLRDCPPDLYARLISTVDSLSFLNQLKSLQQNLFDGSYCKFPFQEASGAHLQSPEILIDVDLEEPSWWVWVTEEMSPINVEEKSGIDNENYVVVSEEDVVDGVANFMARCMLSNPKALNMTPEELQKTLTKALGGMNKVEKMLTVWHAGKMFYTLATWGLALAGTRAVLKVAALGVHTSSKVVLKAI